MSYPRDLDEFRTQELEAELKRRRERLEVGNCDYCNRAGDSKPCMYSERHETARVALAEIRAVAARQHVCGAAGYDGMRDPPCPGCEYDRQQYEKQRDN
jgi:hypothetical protein